MNKINIEQLDFDKKISERNFLLITSLDTSNLESYLRLLLKELKIIKSNFKVGYYSRFSKSKVSVIKKIAGSKICKSLLFNSGDEKTSLISEIKKELAFFTD